ncbi:MAG: haloacid dehalogenase-like hydrolase [Oscillospiraceae bacterium]|jgi:phosphoserine phosphatase|nr:haloacid dehalogenase-like hydrolase [Oscillospiraceae bacterium]
MNVFDFDNTIYHGESGVHMFLFFLRKHPELLRFTFRVIQGVTLYKLHFIDIDSALERYERVLNECFATIGDFNEAAVEFWDAHEKGIRPWYKTVQQEDDLIISAGPTASLREICKRLGVKRFLGTIINEETHELEFICFRQNKVAAFHENYPGETIETFYTDSYNDKPLMDIAQHVFFVKGNRLRQIK